MFHLILAILAVFILMPVCILIEGIRSLIQGD